MSGTLTLGQAAFMGDLQALRRELAKGPVIDEYDNHGLTLLHKLCGGPPRHGFDASEYNRLACFHLLIEAGADPTKRTGAGNWFPLLYAAEHAHAELVAALLATSAQSDLNQATTFLLQTPLHCACRSRSPSTVECVASLLSRGAAVNARDRNGSTPLDYATSHRERRLYPVLLRAGAALPEPGTDQWERTIGYDRLDGLQVHFLYLRKVAAAGGYRNYARDHLNALSATFAPKLSHRLPPEMVRRVVEYAFDVGGH